MNRTHEVRLVDQSAPEDRVHAVVIYAVRGPNRHHWRAECEDDGCGWKGEWREALGTAAHDAYNHGLHDHGEEG